MVRRAVSSLLATIVIMAMSLLGGWIAYNIVIHALRAQGGGVKIWVEGASIARDITGVATLTCTIKNVGVEPITSLTLKVGGETLFFPNVAPSRPLMPSQSASIVTDLEGGVLAGESYTITIIARGEGGSEVAHVMTVKAAGGGGPVWSPPGSGGFSGGEAGGSRGGQQIIYLFFDDFKSGLSGWMLWGEFSGFSIEVDSHGKPAPCLHVYGRGRVGAAVGAFKEVEVNQSAGSAIIIFDFNVLARKDDGAFPGNLWVRLDADGVTVLNELVYDAKSAGSGWKSSQLSAFLSWAPRKLTLIFFMVIESAKTQDFWLDNIGLAVS
jgi:hypothetical protein